MARGDLRNHADVHTFRLRWVAGKRDASGQLHLQGHCLRPWNRSHAIAGADAHGDAVTWGPRDPLLSIGTVLLLLLVGMKATAQAVPTATGPGTTIVAGGGVSFFDSPYGQRDLGGVFVFADIQPHWRFGVELEARTLRVHTSEEISEKNYLTGPRVLLRSGRWQPYAKFLIGDGHIDLPFHYARGDFLALVPGAGLDLELNEYINVRAIDVEYQLWRDSPFGDVRPYGISSGISFRLTPIARFPKGTRVRH